MTWLRARRRVIPLNVAAVAVLVYVLTQGSRDWSADAFDPELESGKWAIRWLLLCLLMTPLNVYLGWRWAAGLRKSAGLWAFAFAALHVLLFLSEPQRIMLRLPLPLFLAIGIAALAILTALAVTSNRWAMRKLGKGWKRLHRLVYAAGGLAVLHGILAAAVSKKVMARDPHAINELRLYAALLAVLLIVRLPLVRHTFTRITHPRRQLPRSRQQADLPGLPGSAAQPVWRVEYKRPTAEQVEEVGDRGMRT